MKVVLTLSRRGSIRLPLRLRNALGLRPSDEIIATVTPDGLLLTSAVDHFLELYTVDREREFDAAERDLASGLEVSDAKAELATKLHRRRRDG